MMLHNPFGAGKGTEDGQRCSWGGTTLLRMHAGMRDFLHPLEQCMAGNAFLVSPLPPSGRSAANTADLSRLPVAGRERRRRRDAVYSSRPPCSHSSSYCVASRSGQASTPADRCTYTFFSFFHSWVKVRAIKNKNKDGARSPRG